jgi:Kef-type K+ transport system membrane component KefB
MDITVFGLVDELQDLLQEVWFELTFLLVVSLFASFLFARFGQPKVIGYIVVGVAIGPSVLGIISAPIDGGVNGEGPSGFPESIQMLAELGAIVLMFMIGLECDLKEIYSKRSIAIAAGGVLLPWGGGYLVASLMGYESHVAVFVGATLVATSVAITASIAAELGLIGSPVASALLGAAVIDDILGMLVLGVSKGIALGNLNVAGLVLVVFAAAAFVIVGGVLGSRYLTKLVFKVQISGYKRKLPMSGFVFALSIAFLYAFIAEIIQISAIVGAFVAGTIFSGSALRDGLRKGSQYLEALFVPIFFVSLGVVVNVGEIWDAIIFGTVLTLVAVLTKVVGCGVPARISGMSWSDSWAVGVGMTPRLEIALVIAYYGLSTGIIGQDVYSVVIFMGLLTALFSPILLKRMLAPSGLQIEPG